MYSQTELPQSAGIGLKPSHYSAVLGVGDGGAPIAPKPNWVEVHPQNYFGAGGPPHRWLSAINEQMPVSFHSVGLSLGSADGCDLEELEQLAKLCDRYQPAKVSDHLSWSNAGRQSYPDLLPVPYTEESLRHFVREIDRVQNRLGRKILIENPSRYIAWAADAVEEASFLNMLCAWSGCGLLLDINNVDVSATNIGFNAISYLNAIDPVLVEEIHLAGHAVENHPGGPLWIDDHGSAVTDQCWSLYEHFMARSGPRPTLIEWDNAVPDYALLLGEATKADAILQHFSETYHVAA